MARLRDEPVAEVAVAGAVPDEAVGDIAPLSFSGDARTAAPTWRTSTAGSTRTSSKPPPAGRWPAGPRPSTARTTPPEAVASSAAVDELLYGGDSTKRTRLVVRRPELKSLRITTLDAHAAPARMTVEAELTGRRYRENRDTTTVVDGSKENEVTFTESWTMALGGNDETPWRLVGSGQFTLG